jgi:hypothetical protein
MFSKAIEIKCWQIAEYAVRNELYLPSDKMNENHLIFQKNLVTLIERKDLQIYKYIYVSFLNYKYLLLISYKIS